MKSTKSSAETSKPAKASSSDVKVFTRPSPAGRKVYPGSPSREGPTGGGSKASKPLRLPRRAGADWGP